MAELNEETWDAERWGGTPNGVGKLVQSQKHAQAENQRVLAVMATGFATQFWGELSGRLKRRRDLCRQELERVDPGAATKIAQLQAEIKVFGLLLDAQTSIQRELLKHQTG